MILFKVAREGYPFILFFLIITVIFFFLKAGWITLFPVILTLFMLFFFRDPERYPPEIKGAFLSPADGRIILIKNIFEENYLKKNAVMISIFMSPLDVHVNRSPATGRVKMVKHNSGSFFAAYREEASLKNENIEMVLETDTGEILIRQVAGFIARRAVCRLKPGDYIRRGERFGIIKFSSRLDVYLPPETDIMVSINQKVKAGETVLGILKR